jgi:hypothetical protein
MHFGGQYCLGVIIVAVSNLAGDTFVENLESRLAVNYRFAITAQNSISLITFVFIPDGINCRMLFSNLGIEFIQDIVVGRKEVGKFYTFALIAKLKSVPDRHLVLVIGERIPGGCLQFTNVLTFNLTDAIDPGNKWILGIHPAGGLALAVGNRLGAFLTLNGNGGEWYLWKDSKAKHYPRAIDISTDGFIFVAMHIHYMDGQIDNDDPDRRVIVSDIPIPTLFYYKLDESIIFRGARSLLGYSDILSGGIDYREHAFMTISVGGLVQDSDWSIAVGLPYMDMVFLVKVLVNGSLVTKMHRSPQTGVQFGHSIYMTENRTYAVLAFSLQHYHGLVHVSK